MSAIEANNFQDIASAEFKEVNIGGTPPSPVVAKSIRKPKKIIHFSDGTTMEEEPDDQQDEVESPNVKVVQSSQESHPPVDPKTLTWPEWVQHYSYKGGNTVLGGLESAGESLAYYLGITTPKYQHEIDEYNRIVEKKNAEQAEARAWASTNPSAVPIVADQRTENQEASRSLTLTTFSSNHEDDNGVFK